MKLVALIKPKRQIFKEIKYYKKKIFNEIGSQTYLDHLPHITIFSLNVDEKKINKNHKKSITLKKNYKKDMILNVKKRFYFKNDPLTKKTTFAIFFEKNSSLDLIQKKLLINFKNTLILKKKKVVKNNFDRNYNLYGYHFVNTSWKPHCTIASVDKSLSKNKVFIEFLKQKKIYSEKIIFIYFYEYFGGKHKLLWKNKIRYE